MVTEESVFCVCGKKKGMYLLRNGEVELYQFVRHQSWFADVATSVTRRHIDDWTRCRHCKRVLSTTQQHLQEAWQCRDSWGHITLRRRTDGVDSSN